MSIAAAVEVESLVKRYGPTTAVDGLSFTVATGSITAILGPNGAGKTTTVEICEGFRRPDEGTVRVLGLDPRRDGTALRPQVGVMLQESGGLYPGARAEEFLTHLARLHAHPLPVPSLMTRLGLPSSPAPLRRLSGGQRQRVALAAAIVGRPRLVFLDEPTAGLDPHARRAVWELLADLRADGVTVVLTTHLIDEAERLADQVLIVDGGRLVAAGTPAELTSRGEAGLVRFTGPARLDLTSLRAALAQTAEVEETFPGTYQITASVGPELLATVTSWCVANDVSAESITITTRTLEDVFLELTGTELT